MGRFINILFFHLIYIFETVGEATIQTRNLLLKLIVLFIKGVNYLGLYTTIALYFLLRSIKKYFNNTLHLLKKIRLPDLRFSMTIKIPKRKKARKAKRTPFSVILPKIPKLPRLMPRFTLPRAGTAFIFGFVLSVVTVAVPIGAVVVTQALPNPTMLTARSVPVTTKIYDRNGKLLYEIYADQNRTPVALNEIPAHFKNATIAIEDKDFYSHHGFSVTGIIRAAYSILRNNDMQGGSTLTQQLVRSALLTPEVTVQRKLKELIVSVWAEKVYSKEEILEMYFNQIPYGGTAWGAEAAAQTYFGKSIRDVTLAEASLLAGLPAAPSSYSPFGAHPEFARVRQKEVLRRMQEDGHITAVEREEAENAQLVYRTPDIGLQAPHFVMYVKDLLSRKYGISRVEQGGLRVVTSLDLSLQEKVQEIVANDVESLKGLNVGNGAAVVADPKSGEILAMVGSTDYFNIERDGNVNVALTPQQPGSTIKVVTYAAALQNGFTAATLIQDTPITYRFEGSPSYSPVNYDGRFHGHVPLRQALGNSYNVPAVKTLAKVGLPTMMEQAKKMGITSWTDSSSYGLSLTLGGGEVTMLEMTNVFGSLANNGELVPVNPIIEVKDYLGHTVEDNRFKFGTRALPEEIAFLISDILSDNDARKNAFGSNSMLNIPGSWVAVKTGTTDTKRDNWTIGYTKDFVVATWVGNNDNSPMHPTLTSGITGAAPIWRKITDHMLTQYPSTQPSAPRSIVRAQCRGRNEYFIAGTEKNGCTPLPSEKQDTLAEDRQGLFTVNAEENENGGLTRETRKRLEELQEQNRRRQLEQERQRRRD